MTSNSDAKQHIINAFSEAIRRGLSQKQKIIPARYFYDQRGSELFEKITRLPEYYPTRTEVSLLKAHSGEIARIVGENRVVVEFGSGSSMKTPIFVEALDAAAYVPIDISADFLFAAARDLAEALPGLDVLPVAGDFTKEIALPSAVAGMSMIGFFPGSTIGNLTPAAAIDMLRSFRAILGQDPWLAIGIDLKKNIHTLEAAYEDADGVTAAFNLNLLARINRELGGNIDLDAFEHRAKWNADEGRIEMHLVVRHGTDFEIAGEHYAMRAGETIHTENSYKYSLSETDFLARAANWQPVRHWVDDAALFSLHLWRGTAAGQQP